MTALTAIDILLDPDASMLARAAELNARLLASMPPPTGFRLDTDHRPHITMLQRYVRTAELDSVYAAIDEVRAAVDLSHLTLTAHALTHVVLRPPVGIGVIAVIPDSATRDFQAALIAAISPYTVRGGSAEAFVRTEAEPEINSETIEFIENYVPQHSGKDYVAHVTVGLARSDDLSALETEPFEPFIFRADAVSVYQLGNNGAAARHLRSWPG